MDLLFDLDGTLTNPETGITSCIQHAMQKLGHRPPPRDALRRCIGPPLRTTFSQLLDSRDNRLLDRAIAHYRERFSETGLFENEVHAGMQESLALLRGRGHRLWVVTSKPQVYARRIVDHFALGALFAGIYGSELNGDRIDKAELIAFMMQRESLESGQSCMIGDRAQDILGGRANRTRTVGVLWGFGTETELREAEPDAVVRSMTELAAFVEAYNS